MLPDFFVIGAQKAGSTYLLQCLGEHPQIFMPPSEVVFFEESFYSTDRIHEFESHFRPARADQVVGVKRPNLLGRPECPERLQRHMPNLKLVVILRNPIERAVSGYFHYMKTGLLPIEPVEVGMRRILEGAYEEFPRSRDVLEFGLYGKHLVHYSNYFPRQSFLVMLFEEVKYSPVEQLANLFSFLEVDATYLPISITSRPMKAPYSIPRLRLWDAIDRHCRRRVADEGYFDRKPGILTSPLAVLNNALDRHVWERLFPASRPRLSHSLHDDLRAYYREDVECLETWLGRPLSDWSDFVGLPAMIGAT